MRFLVTGANGDIGEALGRLLQEAYPDSVVDGADAAGGWPGGFVYKRIHGLPLASDPAYSEQLARLSRDYDLVIPSSEPELQRLAEDTGCGAPADGLPLLMVRPELLRVFLDKLETARWLAGHGLGAPRSELLADVTEGDLPLLLKPRRGAGGRGQEIVRSAARLAVARAEHPETTVAQELLDVCDQEYTCALFAHKGEIRSLAMRRWLAGGHTAKAEVVVNPVITALLEGIARASHLEGCINVQLRLTADGPKVFEINPRLSSTVMMRHRLGFPDLVWWVEAASGRALPPLCTPAPGAVVYRMAVEKVVPAP